eukprot:TRINITY_DN4202_c0_g1_i2.p1 TRINITY_DN4202_c0_g1~~TRINITY_DN4202_c0_g1_i2.p1  ORF type:complete len:167 (-),score=26.86 TRINITY_DN4202_c0_g1_i2:368-868(-)
MRGLGDVPHQQHVVGVLRRRTNCLLAQIPWMSPDYSLSALTPAERSTAAAEAVSLAAEQEAMMLVLDDICPSSDNCVRVLAYALEAMGTRLSEVMESARSEDVRASARSRSEAEGDGPRHAVLANPQLLASIMTFTGYGQWLYLASVAPSWRTAYMSVTARRQGVP